VTAEGHHPLKIGVGAVNFCSHNRRQLDGCMITERPGSWFFENRKTRRIWIKMMERR